MVIMFLLCLSMSVLMSEALKHENNKIKRKFAFISVNTINIFISCNENIQIFIRASHSENTDVPFMKIFMVFTPTEQISSISPICCLLN